ncbi:monovalent cation:H+ antiporter, CPA1 (nhx1) [Serendipita sp. 399]|nr:monovalent cation:H+ antiporter, CPA1 (nhx1) [Serendipita sp. 399]
MSAVIERRESSEVEELYSSWSLFIVCGLLILSLLTSYYLQIKRIRAIHETVVSIFAGMVVGLIVRVSGGYLIRDMLRSYPTLKSFSHTLFFNLLLPPIILNSGYEMRQENFFRNFGSILTFAFFGTFISAVGLGILVYIWSILGLEGLKLTMVDCLIFGSTLSATDPVTILSIFQQYKVDPKLYSIIFGESLLNDAVSIVMYETLTRIRNLQESTGSLLEGVGIFILSFSSSMALGVAFGLCTSLILKHSHLSLYPSIESCLVALFAYTSYFFSNGVKMSGIVSLLFCGITLKHYAYHTMSRRTQRTTKYLFAVLAQLTENFIFIYLGLNLFTQEFAVFKPLFILISTIAVVATRYLAVFPLSEIINFFHRWRGQRQQELPHSYQMMLFWAGLRGAVGVALAAGFTGISAEALRTTVLVVVVLTVIMFGGTTARMLEVMGIRTGVEEIDESSSEEEERAWLRSGRLGTPGARWDTSPSRFRNLPNSQASQHTRRWSRSNPNPPSVHRQNTNTSASLFDVGSSDSDGNEVLPMSRGGRHQHNHTHQQQYPGSSRSRRFGNIPEINGQGGLNNTNNNGSLRQAGEAWFHAIDERYLLPLFSNAVASRSFHARIANRRATLSQTALNAPGPHYDDSEYDSHPDSPTVDGGGGGTGSPAGSLFNPEAVTGAVKRKNQEVFRSIGSFWRGSPPPPKPRDRETVREQGVVGSSGSQPHQGNVDGSGPTQGTQGGGSSNI